MENINMRIAEQKDIDSINKLLYQVHKIHADARPDLFLQGEKKYTDEELSEIITNQLQTPVFVAEFDGVIVGYAFCQVIRTPTNNRNINTLYIDDLCVDEECRGNHIGTILLDYELDENTAYEFVLYTSNYGDYDRFKECVVVSYDFNEELSGEEVVIEKGWFKQIEFDLQTNKIYVVTLSFKNGDFVEYTFNTKLN